VNTVTIDASSACNSDYTVKIVLESTSGIALYTSQCTKDVHVGDETAPVFTFCPPDMVIECDASLDPASTGGAATATDNCSSVTPEYSDQSDSKGCITYITRTWTATDACGNSATCVQYITKRDRTAPVIGCENGEVVATDNCTAQENITLFFSNGQWTAIDESGNYSTSTINCDPPPAPALRIIEGSSELTEQPVQDKKEEAGTTEEKTEAAGRVNELPANDIQVKAVPNPFKEKVYFQVSVRQAGYASLEVMNMLGQKVKTVYQGYMQAGSQQFEMSMPASRFGTLVYVFSLDGKRVTGKLVQLAHQ